MDTPRPPASELPEPSDEVLGALIRAALAGAVPGRLSDEDWETAARLTAGEAADDAALRAVQAEVADALATVGAGPPPALGADVRAAALAAWDATREAAAAASPVPAPTVSSRVLRTVRPVDTGWLRWAAVVLVALGVGLLVVLSSPAEAVAGLRLTALVRLDLESGRHETTSGRRFRAGERLAAGPREMLGFSLPDGGAVVLSDGGAVRVMSAGTTGPELKMEAGTVRVAVRDGPLRLVLDGSSALVLEQGRAWLSGSTLAVSAAGRARLEGAGGASLALEGPVLGTRADGGFRIEGRPSADRFLMPAVLGASHLGRPPGRLVPARRWRVTGGEARRVGTSLALGPGRTRIAWRPDGGVRRARTLRLLVEGPEGLRVIVPSLDVETVLGPSPASGVPDRRRVDLALPAGWYDGFEPRDTELVLVFEGKARFIGASFLVSGAAGVDR